MEKVIEGRKITKLEWNNRDDYGLLINGQLCIHKHGEAHDVFRSWIISEGDLIGKDWVEI